MFATKHNTSKGISPTTSEEANGHGIQKSVRHIFKLLEEFYYLIQCFDGAYVAVKRQNCELMHIRLLSFVVYFIQMNSPISWNWVLLQTDLLFCLRLTMEHFAAIKNI